MVKGNANVHNGYQEKCEKLSLASVKVLIINT